ncbi:hypothetical protein QOZ80_1BG0065150 [Eleusine coracana subsp. coracana]|nr:hypothetical protein QOZ80_1BG0065150 [Eleusine coracana subsp. coracana]
MGLGAQEEEVVTEMVSEEEGSGGEERGEPEGGGAKAEGDVERKDQAETVLQCSICLDTVVVGGGDRSIARLQCGHEFHLDCIGSAFNSRGIMQCPNCQQIEKGHWLYARGPASSQHINNDDWVFDEDLYDFAHPDVLGPLHFRWCPIGRLSELPSLFNEIEASQTAPFHDVMGQNFNAEPMALPEPGTSHPGAYVAYLPPLSPPVSSSSTHNAERTVDGFAYHDHWNPLAGPSYGHQSLHRGHPTDFHHHLWAPMPHSYSPPNNNNGVAGQPGISVGATRIEGVDSGTQQRGSLPSFYRNRSEWPRIPNVPPMAPQLVRAPGNMNEQFQHGSSSLFAGSQRSGGMRPLGAGGPAMLLPDRTFYQFPPASSGSNSMETTEDVGGNHFYSWERGHFGPHSPVNNEGPWPSSSQQQPPYAAPEPAAAPRRLFRYWGGSARPPPPENRSLDDPSFHHTRLPHM